MYKAVENLSHPMLTFPTEVKWGNTLLSHFTVMLKTSVVFVVYLVSFFVVVAFLCFLLFVGESVA